MKSRSLSILLIGMIFSFISLFVGGNSANADVCLPASQVTNTTGMTQTSMDGQVYYCDFANPIPPISAPTNQTGSPTTIACPTGTRPATASDAAVKTGQIPVGTCYNPNAAGINQSSEQAKQDLQGMTCGSVNISGLDSNFAVCADKFMQALRQQSPGACINSAYRNPQQQLAACMSICGRSSCPGLCAAPGTSYHQKGLAIDVTFKIPVSQAWQIANTSTGGGIANPSGLHSSDPKHFQATGASCSGAPVPQQSVPTDYYTPTANANTFFTPTTPNQQPPAGYCLVNTQPIIYAPCAPQATQPSTTQPAPITSSPTAVVQPAAATSPTITPTSPLSVPTTSSSSLITGLLQTQPLILPSAASSATQAIGIITNLSSATTDSLSLNQNLSTIVNTIISGVTSGNGINYASVPQQTTYQQDTLASNPFQNSTNYAAPFSVVLQSLHNILTNLLSYLQTL